MKKKELLKLMEERKVSIEFTEAEILILHAVATLRDGRNSLTKLLKKKFTPIALEIIKKRPEYQ